jgi:hypothetical protein
MKKIMNEKSSSANLIEKVSQPVVVAIVTTDANQVPALRGSYRVRALKAYPPICTYCGFGIPEILEVAHLDQDRKNNELENLALLCPNCHKMHDIGLIPTDVIKTMRSLEKSVDWKLRVKDAGIKAAKTRSNNKKAAKRSASAKKANITRKAAAASQENAK